MRSTWDLVSAWAALLFLLLLGVIYLLRFAAARHRLPAWLVKTNRALRRAHTPLCYAFYAASLLHGVLSVDRLISFNLGSLCLAAGLLMWLGHALRRRLRVSFVRLHRVLCALCACLALWHVVDTVPLRLPRVVRSWFTTMPTDNFVDGTYRAEATGYRKHLWVEVVIAGGRIERVEVIEHYEKGRDYYEEPIETIPMRIVAAQSIEVEAVSGATLTSLGIVEATRLALLQAVE